MNISDVSPDDLHVGRTRVRHGDSGAEGLFVGWARPGWAQVVPDGEHQAFEWRAQHVEVTT
jgi:hypothetical protein